MARPANSYKTNRGGTRRIQEHLENDGTVKFGLLET